MKYLFRIYTILKNDVEPLDSYISFDLAEEMAHHYNCQDPQPKGYTVKESILKGDIKVYLPFLDNGMEGDKILGVYTTPNRALNCLDTESDYTFGIKTCLLNNLVNHD